MNVFMRIMANSNAHTCSNVVQNKILGYSWQMITGPEMVFFLIMLKISVQGLKLGEYNAYCEK